MKDIIRILGLIIGVAMLIVGKKTKKYKYVNTIGKIIILVCLAMAVPDFIRGFIDGMTAVQ
ncbi:hypothetical protein FDC22_12620 [Clostridium botulinum]|uniref:Uncharacterized protein n=1 Tax=Clostridium botulinum (strain Okra / Type B1) TaxID=498213 RepID=B1IHX1_CLOBK|nr:hypothetical protein [Clostridium botulinum]EKX80313.1 hypothetical protein CFSAN001628_007261 [Clostridium botulinum CFSAN001628]ACA44937.1 conserved hypothetical protein [Clostridium botulinum B1 str. Okra]MBD5562533.1 hypothetical protein [Clostridium botulinum]MBD5565504.1 hypothetical protein [Clostridium botulinum]MBD5569978.1 hypothetical protein [Clostridium botulinum]